jgi:hypothetical protein
VFIPAALVGPAFGAAALYGYEKGHHAAAVPLLQRKLAELQAKHGPIDPKLQRRLQEAADAGKRQMELVLKEVDKQVKRTSDELDLQGMAHEVEARLKDCNLGKLLMAEASKH